MQKKIVKKYAELMHQAQQATGRKEAVGLIKSGISSFSKALAETIVLGKELNKSMKELAQRIMVSILQKIIERIALLAVEKALQIALVSWEERKRQKIEEQNNALKKQLGLRAALGVSSFFGSFLGKQAGGAVAKGRPTLVGERGPELFVPNQTGQITQNARGTGGGSVNVNISITTLDGTGFYPEAGDVVDWNDIYFELNAVTEPQLIGGHQKFKHQIKAIAHRSRLSSLQIEERPR